MRSKKTFRKPRTMMSYEESEQKPARGPSVWFDQPETESEPQ